MEKDKTRMHGDQDISHTRWLWQMAMVIRGGLLLGLALVALKAAAQLAVTAMPKWLIDDVFLGGNTGLLWPVLYAFLAAVLVANGLHILGEMTLNIYAKKANRWLLDRYMTVVHLLPVRVYQNERIGRFTSYYNQEITSITQQVFSSRGGFLSDGVQRLISFVILAVVIGYANVFILIGILAIGCVLIPLGLYFTPRLRALSKEVQEKRTEMNVQLVEGISATREVIAFNRLVWERGVWQRLFDSFLEKSMREVKLTNEQLVYSEGLRLVTSFLVLAYGGYETIRGNLSPGMFFIVFQFSGQLMSSVNGLYSTVMRLPVVFASIDRLRGMMGRGQMALGSVPLTEPVKTISFRHVSFRYQPDAPIVLDRFSLELEQGCKVAFVGASGGGKSTVAQLLIRFFEPDEGEIRVNGMPLAGIREEDWRRKLAIVFQEPYLLPDTIRTNVMLDLEGAASEEQLVEACRCACIHDDILQLPSGYDTVLGERGITLSGGQRQRLALARALLRNPEILILDEATSALDLATERELMRNLDQLRQGRTTIIIAHRLSTVMNADTIYVMDKGSIVEQGTHDQLLARRGVYSHLVEAVAHA